MINIEEKYNQLFARLEGRISAVSIPPAVRTVARHFLIFATIFATTFSGILIPLSQSAHAENLVPSPLEIEQKDPLKEPALFFLQAIEQDNETRKSKLIFDQTASMSFYETVASSGYKILEPEGFESEGVRYIPFRLFVASTSYAVQVRSKQGIQSLVVPQTSSHFLLYESTSSSSFMLATMSAQFQYNPNEATMSPVPVSPTTASASPSVTPEPTILASTSPEIIEQSPEPSVTPQFEIIPSPVLSPSPDATTPVSAPSIPASSSDTSFWKRIPERLGDLFTGQAQASPSADTWSDLAMPEVKTSFVVGKDFVALTQRGSISFSGHDYSGFIEIKIGANPGGTVNKWSYGIKDLTLAEGQTPLGSSAMRVVLETSLRGQLPPDAQVTGEGELTIEIENKEAVLETEPESNPEFLVDEEELEVVLPVEDTPNSPADESTPEPAEPALEDTASASLSPTPTEAVPSEAPLPLPESLPASPSAWLKIFRLVAGAPAHAEDEVPVEVPSVVEQLPVEPELVQAPAVEAAEEQPAEEETVEVIIPSEEVITPPGVTPEPFFPANIIEVVQDAIVEPVVYFVQDQSPASQSEPAVAPEQVQGASTSASGLTQEATPPEEPSLLEQIQQRIRDKQDQEKSTEQPTISSERYATSVRLDFSDHAGEQNQEWDAVKKTNRAYLYDDERERDPSVVFYADPEFGAGVDEAGLTVQSGDGTRPTDFKIHFNTRFGGAIDKLYLGGDFLTNKVTRPRLGGGGLTLVEFGPYSQATATSSIEILEQSKVRTVFTNTFYLGGDQVEETFSVYSIGRIIRTVKINKTSAEKEFWFVNGRATEFSLPLTGDFGQYLLNTDSSPTAYDVMAVWRDPGQFASAAFAEDATGRSFTTTMRVDRASGSYEQNQLLEIMQNDLSIADSSMAERTADYRQPDEPFFSLGDFVRVNDIYNSYEMKSPRGRDRVIFTLDGSQIPRHAPVFEIHNWLTDDLSQVKAALNSKNMVEDVDYVVDFKDGDPETETLIFHFLGTLTVNSDFSADGIGVFDIDPEVTPSTGQLIYSDGQKESYVAVNSNNTLGSFASISASTIDGGMPVGAKIASSPTRNEHIALIRNSAFSIQALRWDGSTWTSEWTEEKVDGIAVEYEKSGEAVAIWANRNTNGSTTELEYKVWDGSNWSASASIDILGTTASATFVEISSHPASGSNQNDLAMCWVKATSTTATGCAIWGGDTNSWGNHFLLESNAGEGLSVANAPTVSVFHEQSSGQVVAVSGVELAGTEDGTEDNLIYATFDNGVGWSATASFNGDDGVNKDEATSLECAAMPTVSSTVKNYAICGWISGSDDDLGEATWNGTTFPSDAGSVNTEFNWNVDTGANVLVTSRVTATWLIDGTNAVGMLVWGSTNAAIDYQRYIYGSGWQTIQSVTPLSTATTDNGHKLFNNPDRKNETFLLIHDGNQDLFAYGASMSGTTVTWKHFNSGLAITKETGTTIGMPAWATYDRAPQPDQIHYIWRNDNGDLSDTGATDAASQDTSLTSVALNDGTIYRLRMELTNEGVATMSIDWNLQFTKKGASCQSPSTGWSWIDIPTSATLASHAFDIEASPNFANGDATSNNTTRGVLTDADPNFVSGAAYDAIGSASSIVINGNNFTEVEFALKTNSNTQASTDYCFRLAPGDSSPASMSHSTYPALQTAATAASTFTQNYFRFYVDNDGLTPTDSWSAITGADLPENATLSAHFNPPDSGGADIRLRLSIQVGTTNLSAGSQTFKLQVGEGVKCGTLSSLNWVDVGASTSSSQWRYGSVAQRDGTTLTTLNLTVSDVAGTYEEGNNTASNPNAINTGQDGEWDFSLNNNGIDAGKSYCFRVAKSDGTALDTYARYPVIISIPGTDQLLRHGVFFNRPASHAYEQPYYWSN